MDEVLKLAKSLREDIDNLPEIQEYYRLKKLMEEDEHLKEMRTQIARLKSEGKNEESKNLLELYNNHPLVNNYNIAREEAIELLKSVKEIIE